MRVTRRGVAVLAMLLLAAGCRSGGPPEAAVPDALLLGGEHRAACEAMARLHAQGPPVETLDAGDITVPQFEGVGPLRGVVISAKPGFRPAPPPDADVVYVLEPDGEYDAVVMVGAVEPPVDELAERIEASADEVVNSGVMEANGRTLSHTLEVQKDGSTTGVTLRDCGSERWFIVRKHIDPASTGECAAAGRRSACGVAVALAEELTDAVAFSSSTPVRPQLDSRGRVVVKVRLEVDAARRHVTELLDLALQDKGWTRTDPPLCPDGIPPPGADPCHTPDNSDLRDANGLRYRRDAKHGPWTAAWRLTNHAKPLRLVLRQ